MQVTVVIPVWDEYVSFLADAVASVRADSPTVPIVVVDNASATPVVAPEGASLVRATERLSIGRARNLGLEQVTTDCVLVLDADDRVLPGTLDLLSERMEADRSLTVCAASILDAETGERHRTPRRFVSGLANRRRLFAFADSVWSLLPIQGCALLRTEQVRDAGGYADASWGDDWVLAVSLAFRGRVEVHDHLGRLYRQAPGSISHQHRSVRDVTASASLVRRRLRSDPGVPRHVRALVPLIATLQLAAIYGVRPLYSLARSIRS